MTFIELQEAVSAWHRGRYPDATMMDIYAKLVSEVGEVGDALLGSWMGGKGVLPDEVGDCLIVLLSLADRAGFSVVDAAASKFARTVARFHPTVELQ